MKNVKQIIVSADCTWYVEIKRINIIIIKIYVQINENKIIGLSLDNTSFQHIFQTQFPIQMETLLFVVKFAFTTSRKIAMVL